MLTPRQAQTLRFIHAHIDATGVSPSYDEIMAGISSHSRSSVFRLVGVLREKGYLSQARQGAHRAIEVTRLPEGWSASGSCLPAVSLCRIPLVEGAVVGPLRDAAGDSTVFVDVAPSMFCSDRLHCALRVSGDAMAGAGILDGDIVVTELDAPVHPGDILAASGDGGPLTLRRLVRMERGGTSVLIEDARGVSQELCSSRLRIDGRMAGLVRLPSAVRI